MGGGLKKEYRTLPGALSDGGGGALTVLGAALSAFAADSRISPIVIVHPLDAETGEFAARAALETYAQAARENRLLFVPGGENRRVSVYHALALLSAYRPDFVLIHDGARPWLEKELLDRIIGGLARHDAVIPVMPLTETPKLIADGVVTEHLRRAAVSAAQTPQGFRFEKIYLAHRKAAERALHAGAEYTDDAEIYGAFAGTVAVTAGDARNRKITFPEDLPPEGGGCAQTNNLDIK
jgi:2-C-methyl-D-erythritol 4-phosphate cytidylyltransferase/2-C-methyl-D-erythritol 4-phosphate cytidylyltransferase/2-C-methyl-D-erythritol 2,4-cyclodiphosphate synthase